MIWENRAFGLPGSNPGSGVNIINSFLLFFKEKMKNTFLVPAILFLVFAFAFLPVLSFDYYGDEELRENVSSDGFFSVRAGEDSVSPDGMNGVIVYFKNSSDYGNAGVLSSFGVSDEVTASSFENVREVRALSDDMEVDYVFQSVEGFTAEVDDETLKRLLENPNVEVYPDLPVYGFLDESVGIINADDLSNYSVGEQNITGEGESICVTDSGINYTHEMFGGCTRSEFLSGDCGKVPGGYDFVNNDSDPMDDSNNLHGTAVSSIISSGNNYLSGVAPGAEIIAVKVLDNRSSGKTSNIVKGMDWCINNSDRFNISVISMSLGGIKYHFADDCDELSIYSDFVSKANDKNISVVAAAGNQGYTGMASPACVRDVISVGATYKNDSIVKRSNINNETDLVAPGAMIRFPYNSTHWRISGGTSLSVPHVSAGLALLRQYLRLNGIDNPTPSFLLDVLKKTGVGTREEKNTTFLSLSGNVSVNVPENVTNFVNSTFKRIDVGEALRGVTFSGGFNYPESSGSLCRNETVSFSAVSIVNVSSVYLNVFQGSDLVNYSEMNLSQGNSSDGNWTLVLNTSNFSDGDYNFSANVTNNYGIEFSEGVSVVIDHKPKVFFHSPPNNSVFNEEVFMNVSAENSCSDLNVTGFPSFFTMPRAI